VSEENIYQAINAIMGEVGYVQKIKTGGLNYSFAGEADLIAAIRPVMVAHGVFMYVVNILDVGVEHYETAKGTQMVNTSLIVKIVFYHAPSGTSFTVTSRGEGADSGDKSSNKALTGAYKYALRETFCIETGDDPDKEPSEERAGKKVKVPPVTETTGVTTSNAIEEDHSQVALVGYADKLGIKAEEIVPILKAGGINAYNKGKWGEMVTLLVAAHEATLAREAKEATIKF
jgi:hypothetical protein